MKRAWSFERERGGERERERGGERERETKGDQLSVGPQIFGLLQKCHCISF